MPDFTKAKAEDVVKRIKVATKESPIAVFRSIEKGRYKAVFAATVQSQNIINTNPPNYIGSFFGELGVDEFFRCI